jgi:tetratricopeptide (TPR) repeat protein
LESTIINRNYSVLLLPETKSDFYMKMTKLFMLAVLSTALSFSAQAQLKTPAPSPLQTIKQAFALSDITIEYSRPSAKGRTVFGDLVPFGKIWRTGANQATKITFGEDVQVAGTALAAGTYALYSIPNKDGWELMFYKDLTLGGNVAEYNKTNEVAKVKVSPEKLAQKVETFTINVSDVTAKSANIELTWENTRIAIPVTADIDAKIMKNIETALANDSRPYFAAASYYYENDKDLKLASEWIDKAIATNPNAYWMQMLKAKIQLKQGMKKEAAATAENVVKLAKEGKNDDYVKMAEKLIADAKK